MNEYGFVLALALYVVAGAVALVLCGLFEREQKNVLRNFFVLLVHPFQRINERLGSFWHEVRDFFREQFTVEGRLDLQSVFFQFIGATLYTLFFLAFNFAEFHLLALSLVAAGIDVGHHSPPMGAGTLTAFAILASILFWGAVICDLIGITRTAPWKDALRKKGRQILLYVTFFALALSLFITVTMGLFRGKVLADESFDPPITSAPLAGGITDLNPETNLNDYGHSAASLSETKKGLYYWIPILANIGIPILVLFGGVFSSWGFVTMIKFLILIVGFCIISPLGLFLILSSILTDIVDRFYSFLDSCLELFGAMGRWIMRLFGRQEASLPQDRHNGSAQTGDSTEETSKEYLYVNEDHNEDYPICKNDEVRQPPSENWNPFDS